MQEHKKNIIGGLNKLFDHRVRLGIMAMLLVSERVDFNQLKAQLGITDGRLAGHIKALEQAGAQVTDIILYHTVPDPAGEARRGLRRMPRGPARTA